MDHDPADEELGARLDECFEQLLTGSSDTSSTRRDVSELQPIVSALATLSLMIVQNETDEAGDHREIDDQSPLSIGKYVIERCLGRGGQSIVFLANDPDLKRSVVIKLHFAAGTPDIQDRLLTEARHLAGVRHPSVVQCYGVDRYEGVPYLVMEYIQGRSLQALLKEAPVSLSTTLQIVADLADGLVAVHARGILHGDIKPGNVLIGEYGRPRLIDFGFSRPIADRESQRVSGTAAYMAPEQARNDVEQVDVRADVFGLGAVFYELLTGRPPFEGSSRQESLDRARAARITPPRQLNGNIPSWVEALCLRCLERDPAKRIDSAELRTRIQMRLMGRNRRFWAVGAVVAIASALLLGFLLIPELRNPTKQREQLAQDTQEKSWREILRTYRQTTASSQSLDRYLRKELGIVLRPVDHQLDVGGKLVLNHGEDVRLQVEAESPCWLAVFSVELTPLEDPVTYCLFPREADGSNHLEIGGLIEFESQAPEPSRGIEFIYAVATSEEWDPRKSGTWIGTYPVYEFEVDPPTGRNTLRSLRRRGKVSEVLIPFKVLPTSEIQPQ